MKLKLKLILREYDYSKGRFNKSLDFQNHQNHSEKHHLYPNRLAFTAFVCKYTNQPVKGRENSYHLFGEYIQLLVILNHVYGQYWTTFKLVFLAQYFFFLSEPNIVQSKIVDVYAWVLGSYSLSHSNVRAPSKVI